MLTPSSERLLAGVAHLGVPLYGPVLPLGVWAVSGKDSLLRRHDSQAFSFQLVFMVMWVILIGSYLVTTALPSGAPGWGPVVMVVVVGVALILEIPNVVRGLRGREPLRIPPFKILN